MERRITAIMLADIAGYSRLTEADEIATLEQQKTHLIEVIEPTLAEYNGDLLKSTGDGFLAVFPSVIESVNAAISIQRTIERRDADVPQDRRLRYRLGINLGDVVFENGDVHGNGVNVAARLEAIADPGGICISGTAYDQVRSAVEVGYAELGDVRVKNITQPVRAYKLLLDPEQAGTFIAAPKQLRSTVAFTAATLLVLLVIAGGLYWWTQPLEKEFAGPCDLANPDQPKIAVLAFDNLTGNPDMTYVGDGLSENIITYLALNPKLFVIGRNSSFKYKDKPTDVRLIATELDVRYVLEGSIQASGDRLRIIAQLIDAEDGEQIWTERYDADLASNDLLDLQDKITKRIFVSMDAELVSGHKPDQVQYNLAMVEDDFETFKLVLDAVSEYQEFSPESIARAEEHARKALERAPDEASAMGILGYIITTPIRIDQSNDWDTSLFEARGLAERMIELAPNHPHSYLLLAWVELKQGNFTAAVSNADKAMALAEDGGIGASIAGIIYAMSGEPERGIKYYCLGMRTEPAFPGWVSYQLAIALIMLDRVDEAISVLDDLMKGGKLPDAAAIKAALLVQQGQEAQAKELVEEWHNKFPWMSIFNVSGAFNDAKDTAFRERMVDALRTAGVPE